MAARPLHTAHFPTLQLTVRPHRIHTVQQVIESDPDSSGEEEEDKYRKREEQEGKEGEGGGTNGSKKEEGAEGTEGKEGGSPADEKKDTAGADSKVDDDAAAAAAAGDSSSLDEVKEGNDDDAGSGTEQNQKTNQKKTNQNGNENDELSKTIDAAIKQIATDLSEELFMAQLSKWVYNDLVNKEERGAELTDEEDAELGLLTDVILADEERERASLEHTCTYLRAKRDRRLAEHAAALAGEREGALAGTLPRTRRRLRRRRNGLRKGDRDLLRRLEVVLDEADFKKNTRAHEQEMEGKRAELQVMKAKQSTPGGLSWDERQQMTKMSDALDDDVKAWKDMLVQRRKDAEVGQMHRVKSVRGIFIKLRALQGEYAFLPVSTTVLPPPPTVEEDDATGGAGSDGGLGGGGAGGGGRGPGGIDGDGDGGPTEPRLPPETFHYNMAHTEGKELVEEDLLSSEAKGKEERKLFLLTMQKAHAGASALLGRELIEIEESDDEEEEEEAGQGGGYGGGQDDWGGGEGGYEQYDEEGNLISGGGGGGGGGEGGEDGGGEEQWAEYEQGDAEGKADAAYDGDGGYDGGEGEGVGEESFDYAAPAGDGEVAYEDDDTFEPAGK